MIRSKILANYYLFYLLGVKIVCGVKLSPSTCWCPIKIRLFGPLTAQNCFWPNIGFFGPFDPMPDHKTMQTKCVGGFSFHWYQNFCIFGHFGANTGIFGPFRPMPDQKTMRTRCLGWFSVIWVPKLLISSVKIRIFSPKTTNFGQKLAFLFILGQALPARLVPCWWVDWWLWRVGCISQDTYLLYCILFHYNF